MNISEFAKFAGVSRSAVSRYFNDGYLSEDKKKLIEAAIEKTGYSPSVTARNTSNRVTKLVGVIIPKVSSESCARVTEGISTVLDKAGYKMLLVNTANDNRREVESLELFRTNRVDGVIL
ncbi:MAG: LacI family DNA-binding transcriptional regulator, partial [Firmicutes bacterium]|nr:LacI family DNA-binding transcriptional regulator [Bacillota bacterium]